MITLGEALQAARARIDAVDARLLLQHATGLSHAQLVAYPERMVDAAQLAAFDALVARRAAGEPVAYLIGWREFYGRRFAVAPGVLIPRPDTELLVELALARVREKPAPRILDLGTGSGILAITLALELPGARVLACDRSPDALDVARANAGALDARVEFVASDWYAALGAHRFDLIVSNPPYIAPDDAHLAQGDLRFEPRAALTDGSRDGLDSLRAVVSGAPAHLAPGGWLLVEHGWDQAPACRDLLGRAGFTEIASLADLAGIARVAAGRRE